MSAVFPFVRMAPDGTRSIDIDALFAQYGCVAARVTRTIRVLAEGAARAWCEGRIPEEGLRPLVCWTPESWKDFAEIRFPIGRVILQDASGLPLLVDLAALRSQVARAGRSPAQINPAVPVALIIDHSVIASQTTGAEWTALSFPADPLWTWDEHSADFAEPPFFKAGFCEALRDIEAARPLLVLGDAITTDHISPVGAIDPDSGSGRLLMDIGGRVAGPEHLRCPARAS